MTERKFRLERDLENAAVRYSHQRGVLTRKMNGLGFRGWPDRLFLLPNERVEWVEFKLPGEEPTLVQLKVHRMLRKRGHRVHVIKTWGVFLAFFQAATAR